ncbi:hypothetical protein PPACK8108_LOCUS4234 [Phakopsora pachyrhizi]|uniref:Uncharacterized protein n=1 Tax=Phakopsora pachyrhizi TaxID=170000 RepID=A0AAV0AMY2_PHAPC|nr:hypothetical protein PPACK8108_LOCUS4234 [Phakopsora pachyrhizi]
MTQSFFYQNFESYGIRLLKNKLIHTTFQKLLVRASQLTQGGSVIHLGPEKAKEAERCGDGDLERFWVSSWKSRKMISVELIKRVEHPESGFVHDKDQCISPYQDLSPKQAIFFCGDGTACFFKVKEGSKNDLAKHCKRKGQKDELAKAKSSFGDDWIHPRPSTELANVLDYPHRVWLWPTGIGDWLSQRTVAQL